MKVELPHNLTHTYPGWLRLMTSRGCVESSPRSGKRGR